MGNFDFGVTIYDFGFMKNENLRFLKSLLYRGRFRGGLVIYE
jgi:hypothetical protein